MFLLDTVTVSETQKPSINPAIRNFFASTDSKSLFLSVVSIGELHYGLSLIPPGKRRDELEAWVARTEDVFTSRILGVDAEVAKIWGQLRGNVRKRGHNVDFNDLLIAATAIRYDLAVVTRNIKDFAPTGCRIVNPWESKPLGKSGA